MEEPASIRYNNPGAMWDGKVAHRWGSNQHVVLADHQNNHIAIFPTKIQGAAAQFDLWRTSYAGMTLAAAIKRWSGNNSPEAYARALAATGVTLDQRVTPELLASPAGLILMKTQAHWEAGREYPLSDADWAQAQRMVFQRQAAVVAKVKKASTAVGSTASSAAVAHSAGVPEWLVYSLVAVALVTILYWAYRLLQKETGMTICDKVDGFFGSIWAKIKSVFGNSKTIFANVLGFFSIAWVEVGTDLLNFDWETVFKHEVAAVIGLILSLVNIVLRYVTTGPVQFGTPSVEVPVAPVAPVAPSVSVGNSAASPAQAPVAPASGVVQGQ